MVCVIDLLGSQGWNTADIADSLLDYSVRLGSDPWAGQVRSAANRLANRGTGVGTIAEAGTNPFSSLARNEPSEADQRGVMELGDAKVRVGRYLAQR